MILAIDFSQYLATPPPPPPPKKKKNPWEQDCIACFMYYTIFCHKIHYVVSSLIWLLLPIGISDYKYFRGAFNTLWQTV